MKYLVLFLFIVFTACTNKYSVLENNFNEDFFANSNTNSFKLGENYYLKSNLNPELLKKSFIDNQEQFYSIFGFHNSNNEDLNQIDFKNEFVIPIILDKSNIVSKIEINDIHIIDNEVLVKYTVIQLDKLSYLIQPFEIIILEKSMIRDLSKLKLKFSRTTNLL